MVKNLIRFYVLIVVQPWFAIIAQKSFVNLHNILLKLCLTLPYKQPLNHYCFWGLSLEFDLSSFTKKFNLLSSQEIDQVTEVLLHLILLKDPTFFKLQLLPKKNKLASKILLFIILQIMILLLLCITVEIMFFNHRHSHLFSIQEKLICSKKDKFSFLSTKLCSLRNYQASLNAHK